MALRSLTWTMRRGEHWAVLGPNGSGKTTLISLIYADNLQAYTNDIRLFGRKRGSGESIWETKRRIGHVSPHLQVAYRLDLKVFDVVVSVFSTRWAGPGGPVKSNGRRPASGSSVWGSKP